MWYVGVIISSIFVHLIQVHAISVLSYELSHNDIRYMTKLHIQSTKKYIYFFFNVKRLCPDFSDVPLFSSEISHIRGVA